ncbi:hypothetical protein WG66_009669, partial [Moniliophthora roreri]
MSQKRGNCIPIVRRLFFPSDTESSSNVSLATWACQKVIVLYLVRLGMNHRVPFEWYTNNKNSRWYLHSDQEKSLDLDDHHEVKTFNDSPSFSCQ